MWLFLACTPPPPLQPPDILWMVLDTVSAEHLALYGGRVSMPHLERLASESIVFTQAYSHFPMTPEEHWVMLTGLLPEPHLMLQRGSPWMGKTLPEVLQQKGWATAAFVSGLTMTNNIVHLKKSFSYYDENWDFQKQDCRPSALTVAAA